MDQLADAGRRHSDVHERSGRSHHIGSNGAKVDSSAAFNAIIVIESAAASKQSTAKVGYFAVRDRTLPRA